MTEFSGFFAKGSSGGLLTFEPLCRGSSGGLLTLEQVVAKGSSGGLLTFEPSLAKGSSGGLLTLEPCYAKGPSGFGLLTFEQSFAKGSSGCGLLTFEQGHAKGSSGYGLLTLEQWQWVTADEYFGILLMFVAGLFVIGGISLMGISGDLLTGVLIGPHRGGSILRECIHHTQDTLYATKTNHTTTRPGHDYYYTTVSTSERRACGPP